MPDPTPDTAPGLNGFACPTPLRGYPHVTLGHGSGGTLTRDLIEHLFVPGFGGDTGAPLEDQAVLTVGGVGDGAKLAFTTDSFVVRPLFFPGGDIGRLAVHGTVNDLAVGGAVPRHLSAAFIVEEGLPMGDLRRVVASMREACDEAGVRLVTGDTKVVDRGHGDGLYITTAGVGVVPAGREMSIAAARPGDKLIVNGTVGDHGIAIMSVREGLEFETVLESDCAALNGLVEAMFAAVPATSGGGGVGGGGGGSIRCMRDATRGGLSSVLNELADASGVGVRLEESAVPVRNEVRAACEMLGLDVLYVANEGKLVAAVDPDHADAVLDAMRAHPLGRGAAVIGEVVADHAGLVVLRSLIGGERVVTMIAGEQLPRIC